ncbi:MAG: hypothetical protein OEW33_14340 [Nitrospirota bacterium]|nr:hypothetical protein [Nitrospirota bacterium]
MTRTPVPARSRRTLDLPADDAGQGDELLRLGWCIVGNEFQLEHSSALAGRRHHLVLL